MRGMAAAGCGVRGGGRRRRGGGRRRRGGGRRRRLRATPRTKGDGSHRGLTAARCSSRVGGGQSGARAEAEG
jgi:hypothetical protein